MRIADDRAVVPQLALWSEPAGIADVSVRHSRRARRVAVRISAGGRVELVVPRGVAERHAWAFFESRADWIRHHVARRRIAAPLPAPFPPREIHLALTGERWRVFVAGGTGRARLHAEAGVVWLRGTPDPAAWRRLLRLWIKRRAAVELAPRLAAEAARHGFRYSAMCVRFQRTRWGSCSTSGLISLNVSLLFQPPEVVSYLLCHELAHTRHMDHSARFWSCVAACEPRWKELDAALCRGWNRVPEWVLEPA